MGLRTFHAILWILCSLIPLGGCALLEPPEKDLPPGPQTQVFVVPYDEVWRAVQKALINYPIQLNNIDQGLIETDIIKAEQVWRPPFGAPPANWRYFLRVKVGKGDVNGRPSTRVAIFKNISLEKDFFSGEDKLPSDGFEEKAILYRIERELILEHSLKKAFERRNI